MMSPLRIACPALVLLAFLPDRAAGQVSPLHVNREYRFAVIFPDMPAARDVSFTAAGGLSVPARQFVVERDEGRYAVTVVEFPAGRSADRRIVEHAAEQLRKRGEVRFEARADYDPGIPGRQLDIFEPDGRQLRASVYMYDRRLYVTEASARAGDLAALQFEQSITLLDEDGEDLDRDGLDYVVAFIRRLLGWDAR